MVRVQVRGSPVAVVGSRGNNRRRPGRRRRRPSTPRHGARHLCRRDRTARRHRGCECLWSLWHRSTGCLVRSLDSSNLSLQLRKLHGALGTNTLEFGFVSEAFTLQVSLVLGTPLLNTALERHTLFLDFVLGGTGHCLASGSVRALSSSGLLIAELPLFIYMGQVGKLSLPTLGLVQQPAHCAPVIGGGPASGG